ncbi:hypothetical protein AGMMS49992_08640 [Clostridia bacterium]|nr:hypothetical protein AGMMS49992_08640 [Clostridia bacterium]
MTHVTSAEFISNVGKYLQVAANGDVVLIQDGDSKMWLGKDEYMDYSRMPAPITDSLYGIVKDYKSITLDQIREERLAKYLSQNEE